MDTATKKSQSASGGAESHDGPSGQVYVRGVGYMAPEELFDRFTNDRMYGNEVSAYVEAVLKTDTPGKVDSVMQYAERYPDNDQSVAGNLAYAKRTELGPWLEANAGELTVSEWSDLGRILARDGWRDSVVAQVLMEQVCCNEDKRSRSASARAFVGMGTLEEVRRIAAIGDTSSWKSMRWTAISAQARFDVPEFNQQVRAALRDTSRLHTRMLEGLEENHRHDFLPELRIARKQLRGTWPNYSMSYLADLIAELEEKKGSRSPARCAAGLSKHYAGRFYVYAMMRLIAGPMDAFLTAVRETQRVAETRFGGQAQMQKPEHDARLRQIAETLSQPGHQPALNPSLTAFLRDGAVLESLGEGPTPDDGSVSDADAFHHLWNSIDLSITRCPACERLMDPNWGWCPYHADPTFFSRKDGLEPTEDSFKDFIRNLDDDPNTDLGVTEHLDSPLRRQKERDGRLFVHWTEFEVFRRAISSVDTSND